MVEKTHNAQSSQNIRVDTLEKKKKIGEWPETESDLALKLSGEGFLCHEIANKLHAEGFPLRSSEAVRQKIKRLTVGKAEVINIVDPGLKPSVEIAPSAGNEIPLVIFGCVHIGHKDADLELGKKYVDFVIRHNGFALLLADNHECALPHKGHMMYDQVKSPQEQYDYGVEMFRPIADRIVGACTGNHTGRAYKVAGVDLDKCMADRLGYLDRYHPHQGFITVKAGEIEYRIAFKHGRGTPNNVFKSCVELQRAYPTADICCGSHIHMMASTKVGRWDIKEGERFKRNVTYVVTGSLLDYPSYADEAGYPPQPKGFSIIWLSKERYFVRADTSGIDPCLL